MQLKFYLRMLSPISVLMNNLTYLRATSAAINSKIYGSTQEEKSIIKVCLVFKAGFY